jgi:hypothetical protein
MEGNIAVYNCDGELLQWIDQKRCQRLVDVGRVARVVKTRAGLVRRITLRHMPGEWQPSLLSDYKEPRVPPGGSRLTRFPLRPWKRGMVFGIYSLSVRSLVTPGLLR